MAPRAVVIGLASVTGLQTARILTRRGVGVIGIAGNRRHFAARTRVCERIIEADVHSTDFLDVLDRLAADLDEPAVLFPCTDQAVLVVSEHRERLEPAYHVVLPPNEVVRSLTEKARFFVQARDLGLPVPLTMVLRNRQDAVIAAEQLPLPSVLKPSVKCPRWKRNTSLKVRLVSTPADLIGAYEQLSPWTDTLVAQEFIGGGDDALYTCNCYFDGMHEPLVTFVTRKRRQWPPRIGTASFGEECRNDKVVEETVRLFRETKFRGLGYLELKQDPRTGRYLVIEANIGRPTGRSATAEAGGVELLYTMYCDAAGLPLPTRRQQTQSGAAWVDLRRDVLSAVYYIRRGELTTRAWLHSLRRPLAHAVLSRSDPLPFVFELAQSGRKGLRRLRHRAAHRGQGQRDQGRAATSSLTSRRRPV